MSALNIVCLAKDWSEDPTSCNHVMRALSRGNRVLWLNSLATRPPDLRSGRDLRKLGRKLLGFLDGPRQLQPNLWVYTPLVLPFPYSPAAVRVNRAILEATLSRLRRRLLMRDFQLWTFLPTTAAYIGALGESLSVYYCTDEWSAFAQLAGRPVAEAERALCGKVDVVFTTSRQLLARKKSYNPETHLASHGVDHAHFASALDEATAVPEELTKLPRPIVGFFGLIESWIDLELLRQLAARRPDWSIVLIGKAAVDVSTLRRHPNIHLLGRRPYAELPRLAKGFDVAVCPFVLNELTESVNPIKLREYLSAGVPVVATDIPEARAYARSCHVVRGADAFLAACEAALREGSAEQRRQRSDAMRQETWEAKVAETLRTALGVKSGRAAA